MIQHWKNIPLEGTDACTGLPRASSATPARRPVVLGPTIVEQLLDFWSGDGDGGGGGGGYGELRLVFDLLPMNLLQVRDTRCTATH